jgi:hypothetical protein
MAKEKKNIECEKIKSSSEGWVKTSVLSRFRFSGGQNKISGGRNKNFGCGAAIWST